MENNACNLIKFEATMNDRRINSAAILGTIKQTFLKDMNKYERETMELW